RISRLAGKSKQLAAGYDELKVRTGGEYPGELACRIDQMLEVVEDEQEPAVGDAVGKTVLRFDCLGGNLEHELRVPQRRKRGPEDAVGIVVGGFCGRLEREPGLPGSGRAGQRQQAHVATPEQARHLVELSLPPEERRRWNREVR